MKNVLDKLIRVLKIWVCAEAIDLKGDFMPTNNHSQYVNEEDMVQQSREKHQFSFYETTDNRCAMSLAGCGKNEKAHNTR
ncbi:hypothetical protein HispidOSU_026314, partial [Sigmodon hispidus]